MPGPAPLPAPASQPTSQPTSAPTAPTEAAESAAPKSQPSPAPAKPTEPAPDEPLPPAPNPQRELKPSDEARRAVRGLPRPEPVRPSEELEELRKFEEDAFPRPPVAGARVTTPAPRRAPRPSAQNPPPDLRSHPERPVRPVAPSASAPPRPWLARLALPGLKVRWDPRVIRYLEFYRDNPRGRAIIGTWLKRMGRYRTMITRVLKKHGIPRDLIYVAMVESGFNPSLTSRVGAAGIWQFMAGTGKWYGLQRDYWIDERRNPRLSTEAAARYLKDLHSRFGSWELALAAYNAGFGAVERSIRKYNTNDYWQICRYESGLPWSTTLYVPKILAVAIVGHNRTHFGFDHVKPEPELAHELVSVPTSITVAQAARAAGVETELIERLNPELRRGRTPPSSKAWLRVPRGTQDRFYAALARLKGRRARHRPYRVRLGDTATDIAQDHGISTATLRRINGMRRDDAIRPGLIILVPARRTETAPAAVSSEDKRDRNGKQVGPEEPLLVAVPRGAPRRIPGRERVFYRTVAGDSLRRVARHMQVDATRLAQWNKLDPGARLIPNMVLQAFVAPQLDRRRVRLLDPKKVVVMEAGSESFLDTYEQRQGRKRLSYLVRDGDTLSRIGRRFGLSVGSLARINRFARSTKLSAGQRIVVYVNPDKLRKKRRKRRARRDRKRRRQARQTAAASTRAPRSSR